MIRIGILGAAAVAPRAIVAPARAVAGVVVHGVAARDRARAEAFARTHGLPRVFDSYAALVASDEIDVVYVALANHLHAPWTVRALRAGKHVLVEKPACLDAGEAEEIAAAARASGAVVLEAVMTQHHACQPYLRETIASGRYGALRELSTDVAFVLPDVPGAYRFDPACGGGVFHDESAYWMQLAQVCFAEPPVAMHGRSDLAGPNRVDRTFDARLDYAGGRRAVLACSWERPFQARHRLVFDEARLEIPNFFRPSFGSFALPIRIETTGGRREKAVLEPSCDYTQQLRFLAAAVCGEAEPIAWERSRERASWLARIHASAREAR